MKIAILFVGIWLFFPNVHACRAAPPAEAPQAKKSTKKSFGGSYWGSVIALTDDSMTIDGAGLLVVGPGNEVKRVRQFPVADRLLGVEPPPAIMPRDGYRLRDVQVGDRVYVRFQPVGGEETCILISITRRPGGRVPPSPVPNEEDPIKYHERANADQDWEERGIPLPDRFLPPWDLEARRAKIAPMPHEVIPPIPPATP